MSGGAFDYDQYKIRNISESIESLIEKNGKEKTPEELRSDWRDKSWYEKYPEDKFHYAYSKETIDEFKKAVTILRQAEIYAQRIDYLLSGDDGEETFHKRLKQDLDKI